MGTSHQPLVSGKPTWFQPMKLTHSAEPVETGDFDLKTGDFPEKNVIRIGFCQGFSTLPKFS